MSPHAAPASHGLPLVIDLDGTLLRSDLLLESALMLVKQQPMALFLLPLWLLRGKARLKSEIAQRVAIDPASLPYHQPLLAHLQTEKAAGRRLVLATASHHRYAQAVAAHLQIFDEVMASTDTLNLNGPAKRDALVQRFGAGGFDYAGNAADDLAVWTHCHHGLVVNASASVQRAASRLPQTEVLAEPPTAVLREWGRALRLHQWLKNLLIFVPLLASHQFSAPGQLLRGLVAFVAFGLCASSVYVLNDLFDLAQDRQHPSKHNRPFAAGSLPIAHGLLACPLLLLAAFGLGLALLPGLFSASLALYFGLTLAYSLSLKQMAIVDVVVLALLYTQRIVAGTFAFALPPTFWLLAFSLFIFFSLAMVKRYAELYEARSQLRQGTVHGRGYAHDDLEMIASLGAASGSIAVLIVALYVQDSATSALYSRPEILWLVCPLLLFWVSRTWLITHRGQMHDDPVVFAIKDKTSLVVGALFLAIVWAAR